jgi:hypothetical protein
MSNIQQIAQDYLSAGLSVIPIRNDGTKAPAIAKWEHLKLAALQKNDIQTHFGEDVGIGIIGGAVSGNLEIIDFDDPTLFEPWVAQVKQDGGAEFGKSLVIHQTPNGYHVLYRCEQPVQGNQKLAKRAISGGKKTLIETRGEAGYVIAPGSPAQCHPSQQCYESIQNLVTDLPVITLEQRNLLLNTARSFNECIENFESSNNHVESDSQRPGDIYNERTSVADFENLLVDHGWKIAGRRGDVSLIKRPNKSEPGPSATLNYGGHKQLYVFSSNAAPFDAEKGYTAFQVRTLLKHQGDFKACARELADQGFAVENTTTRSTKSNTAASQEWPEVVPFKYDVPDAQPYPIAALGSILAPAVEAAVRSTLAPDSLCAQSFLAAANLACAGHFDVGIDGRTYPNTDFFITVAASGERKTAADKIALSVHSLQESKLSAAHLNAKKEYDEALSDYKAERSRLGRKADKSEIENLKAPPLPPPPGILKVGDTTIEGLQKLFADGLSRLGVFTTEAGNIFGGWSMQDEQRSRAGACLSTFWDGGADTRARGMTGHARLAGRRLTAHFGCQPNIALSFLGAPDLETDLPP